MKSKYNNIKRLLKISAVLTFFIINLWSCKESSEVEVIETYEVLVDALTNEKAPALQSFIHGVHGSEWLLFAGRTNKPLDSLSGGLHKLNSNYTSTSFIPKSFNTQMFVYDVVRDTTWSKDWISILNDLENICEKLPPLICTQIKPLIDTLRNKKSFFVNTNALVTQDEDFLYFLGGYGPPTNPADSIKFYRTYNQIVRIHIPTMINIVKGDYKKIINNPEDLLQLIRYGKDTENKLVSTGGELFKFNDTFYLAGGQYYDYLNQVYLNAVYPFTLEFPALSFQLKVNKIDDPITDIAADSLGTKYADSTSIFRRRDAPILPAIFKNNNTIEQGITFYAGVFKHRPKNDTLRGWNDAIYVHPSWKNKNKFYSYDSLYNQSNHNIYACSDFVAYDSTAGNLHTFLLGGIGTGSFDSKQTLSGFTNNGVHITMNMNYLKSTKTVIDNVFGSDAPYYGAESALILNESGLQFYISGGDTTEVIDLVKSFKRTDSIHIGYIYGGIEAFTQSPGTYGKNKSAASNKVWKVTLRKK